MSSTSRRQFLAASAAAGLAAPLAHAAESRPASVTTSPAPRFKYCLNTATIRGQNLTLTQQIDVAAKAGYDAIEPWINHIEQHLNTGGTLRDIAKRLADAGLQVPSAIGFPQWLVDDDAARAKGIEQAKRDMDYVRQIGGTRIAAPAAGATKSARIHLDTAARRFAALCAVGKQTGVTPELEIWGFSTNLTTFQECAYIAIAAAADNAAILPDIYHLYKGGTGFQSLHLLSPAATPVFHVNDYPDIPRDKIVDADRVYPGDGVGPLTQAFQAMARADLRPYLSLELFNKQYWQLDALLVARTGLEKTRAAVAKALS